MAIKKYLSLDKLTEYDALIKTEIDKRIDASKITIDSELSSTSTNPVQNKVLNAEFEAVSEAMGALESSIDGKADAAHSHSASNITSGTLPIERGGTGNIWGYIRAGAQEGSSIGALATAEGRETIASGDYSHAEGNYTDATGSSSHAEGQSTEANGSFSHAEGEGAKANGKASHAEGQSTIASGDYSHAQGKYNVEDTSGTYAHIVGNGTGTSARSNAHTVDWDGNANFAGDVYVGNANENKAGKKLATVEYVDTSIEKIQSELVFDSIKLRDISTGFVYLLQIKDGIIVTSSKVTGISMTAQPNKTTYIVGETVDLTGMVIEATCEDGSVKNVANDVTYSPEVITEGVTSIEVKYHSGGSEYVVTVPIAITSVEDLLIDFEYTDNNDGTYTLTGWKQTLNGEPSTEMVIPDNSSIKL